MEVFVLDYEFQFDDRLGIAIPILRKDWSQYPQDTQLEILLKWEQNRGQIPERIYELEKIINEKQAQLNIEEDFDRSCELNSEIAELASIIHDLWIWYRINQVAIEQDSVYA